MRRCAGTMNDSQDSGMSSSLPQSERSLSLSNHLPITRESMTTFDGCSSIASLMLCSFVRPRTNWSFWDAFMGGGTRADGNH